MTKNNQKREAAGRKINGTINSIMFSDLEVKELYEEIMIRLFN